MSKDNVVQFGDRELFTDALTSLLQRGARQLIMQGVKAELDEFMSQFKDRQTQDGRAAVVRNGYQPERQIETAIGPVKVKIPKVRAKDGTPVTFRSALVPPYVRKGQVSGSGTTLALPERDIHRRNGGGTGGSCGSRRQGVVSQYGRAAQAKMGHRVQGLVSAFFGKRSMGLPLG